MHMHFLTVDIQLFPLICNYFSQNQGFSGIIEHFRLQNTEF